MEIDGVNPVITEMPQYTPISEPGLVDEQTPPPALTEEVEAEAVEQEDDGGQAEGVLRLLMEGHFKGVADVRLRINFYEELQALQNQQMAGAAGDEIDGVLEAVDGVLSTLPPAEEPEGSVGEDPEIEEESPDIGQIQQAFADAVDEAKEEFVNSEKPSKTDLVNGLQSAFDSLVLSIRDFFAPAEETGTEEPPQSTGTEPELLVEEVENPDTAEGTGETQEGDEAPPVEPNAEVENLEESEFDVEAFIEELTAAFDGALAALTEALNGVSVLPPLSEPSGNGKAYEKFLSIYNDLYSAGTGGEELNEIEPPVGT